MITPEQVIQLYEKCKRGLELTAVEGMQLIDALRELSVGIVNRDTELAHHAKNEGA